MAISSVPIMPYDTIKERKEKNFHGNLGYFVQAHSAMKKNEERKRKGGKTKRSAGKWHCDAIRICLNRRAATRSRKGNQSQNIKTAIERPILKLGLPNFR